MNITSRWSVVVFGVVLPALTYVSVHHVLDARAASIRAEEIRDLREAHGLPPEGPLDPGQELPAALLDELGIDHGAYDELMVVVISSSTCAGNLEPGFKQAMRDIRGLVTDQVSDVGLRVRMVGVSLDWDPEVGLEYLSEVGEFDEVTVGGNWINLGTQRFVWGSAHALPATVPMVAVLRRTINKGQNAITISSERVLETHAGGAEIVEWVGEGAPLRVVGTSRAQAPPPAKTELSR